VSGLADVARVHKPLHIRLKVQPPEALDQVALHRVNPMVADVVVRLCNE
jgi:hypothetical protein